MSSLITEKAKTCAFTGHRILEKNFNVQNLKIILEGLFDRGYKYFLVGMAIGFDTLCFQLLEEYRVSRDIKIIACVPCKNQSERFTLSQKKEYDRMLSASDDVVYVGKYYTENCMKKRNQYMVNNSSCLVAHILRDFGGTANTVNYAEQKGVKIYFV